ncbi:BREX-1 system adenine-specific DNA-methyltransferase PglX [Arthrobacter sp. 260]|uniref:BREX-1 system adenine-specific DNA-methyltransferase PglX n=1 Tax=Arthrobacter sp. 260 TaxID=2735314 RepID=UPI001491E983|nr:BREX-1 system adenine-specific DNA-methyltransferase PglX [Arthrobacter sp. 260]NOJ60007.1 BREX-1 system adenine-specific DNA-methyltransferase PglX [Arthrobacter sp. 260]
MNTRPLERFAMQARRDLVAAVDAQATTVLATGSVARSERAEAVKKLEAEITAHGRRRVIDKVAYTWFNRIVALRFMDARSYTDAGVVSPAQGQAHGQPEILTDAKRGNLNIDVLINKRTADAIIALLDGTRRSTDAEGEAYALLLTEYCRYWHRSMPFMFEQEADYTELLVPAGLLADGTILSLTREVLTEEVCDDVEVIGWLYQFYISERKDEVFAAFKKNKKAGPDEIPAATQLFTPHWIVRYLVENSLGHLWMLNRPASRLVDQMDYYIAPVDEETEFLEISGPEELTVIDPACGSGHILTYAFDLLYAIYEEVGYAPSEIPSLILTHNLHGTEIDPRAGSLAAFALAMKARAKDRRFFNKNAEPKIYVIEPISFGPAELDFLVTKDGDRFAEEAFWNQFRDADTLGALIQSDATQTKRAEDVLSAINGGNDIIHARTLELARKTVAQAKALSRKYSVAAANPPYMGSKNMDGRLADFVKGAYPHGKQDLYACFVLRAMDFVLHGGFVAKIIGDTWMSIGSFKDLRSDILTGHSFDSFVHLHDVSNHPDIFGANAAFVLSMTNSPGRRAPFVRLTTLNEEEKRLRLIKAINDPDCEWRFTASSEDFAKAPGSPIAYWLSDAMRAAFRYEPLQRIFTTRLGLSTANNDQFLRYWWEVSSGRIAHGCIDRRAAEATRARWFPYQKGGSFRKWYGNLEFVVNWERDGYEVRNFAEEATGRVRSHNYNLDYIFKPGLTWTDITSSENAFRVMDRGQLFDGRGSAGFADDKSKLPVVLGLLNSTTVREIHAAINPTLSLNVGEVARTPFPDVPDSLAGDIASNVTELEAAARLDWDSGEVSWDFETNALLASSANVWRPRIDSVSASYSDVMTSYCDAMAVVSDEQLAREIANNEYIAQAYGLKGEVGTGSALHRVSLNRNVEFRYGAGRSKHEYAALQSKDIAADFVSYAVGCIFGRYSLDKPGLILAEQGSTLQDYLAKVVSAGATSDVTFTPDADNVIPFVDDGWFEDDIVERFRQFLRIAFGEERFEENLSFIEQSLGVPKLRDYFITKTGKSKFYDDHVQRYKKRPIYWMFSSPKGSFNALIYMHRYNPSTVPTVLNEYLRDYRAKLEVALTNAEHAGAAGSTKHQKEADRLRKVIAEVRDYEHDVLYPLATQQLTIDLNDGVKANYPKFYPALKKIVGLEAAG